MSSVNDGEMVSQIQEKRYKYINESYVTVNQFKGNRELSRTPTLTPVRMFVRRYACH